ncbi:MAG: LysE family transporter [Nitrospinota bacterium]
MGETLIPFLISVAAISLTGILMPGPVTAATIALSRNRRWAGLGVGVGHCLVEVPVVALLVWGAGSFLKEPFLQRALGVSGGLVLGWMGWSMLRQRGRLSAGETTGRDEGRSLGREPLKAGLLTSLGNPYIFLWWATVGAAMVAQGERFGATGLAGLAAVHWACDLGWGAAVGVSSYGVLGRMSARLQSAVFAACGFTLFGFGVRFFLLGIL